MNTLHHVGEVEESISIKHCARLMASAEAALSAFMWTIHRVHGAESAEVAGRY